VTRRLLAIVGAAAAAFALAAGSPHVVHACEQSPCVPVLSAATPEQIELNGKPVHITLQGANLAGVTAVRFSPLVPSAAFTIFNDSTILVTLPAGTDPGIYSVGVVSPDGGSDPSTAPQFELFAAPPPSSPPTPRPKATPRPAPTPTPGQAQPDTGIVASVKHDSGTPPPALLQPDGAQVVSPTSAPIDIMAGLILGAVIYLLWGSPRRLPGSFRSAPLLHLFGRPAQALHVGHICLYCGRLHYMWSTRRDLWKAGRYCGPKCFISAEAMPSPLDGEEEEPEPVLAQKKQAWWRAAVAAAEGPEMGDQSEWRPRY